MFQRTRPRMLDTTMKAVAGVLPARSRTVRFGEQDITNARPHDISRQGIAFIPEGRQIFSDLTVEDNLLIGAKKGPRRNRDRTLKRVYYTMPLLVPLQHRMGGQLSGGEQQLLTTGRSLMGNPDVMLLDEPTAGLAPIMVQLVDEPVNNLRQQGTTIILAEQNLQFRLELADSAVVIDRGRDVFAGTIKERNANAELKQRYLSV